MSRRTSQHPQILMLGTPDTQFPLERAFRRPARQHDPQEPGLPDPGRRETGASDGEPEEAGRDEPGQHGGRRERPRVYRGGSR